MVFGRFRLPDLDSQLSALLLQVSRSNINPFIFNFKEHKTLVLFIFCLFSTLVCFATYWFDRLFAFVSLVAIVCLLLDRLHVCFHYLFCCLRLLSL